MACQWLVCFHLRLQGATLTQHETAKTLKLYSLKPEMSGKFGVVVYIEMTRWSLISRIGTKESLILLHDELFYKRCFTASD